MAIKPLSAPASPEETARGVAPKILRVSGNCEAGGERRGKDKSGERSLPPCASVASASLASDAYLDEEESALSPPLADGESSAFKPGRMACAISSGERCFGGRGGGGASFGAP